MSTQSIAVRAVVQDGQQRVFLIHHDQAPFYAEVLSTTFDAEVVARDGDVMPSEIDALLCWKYPLDRLAQLSRLSWIQTTSSGVDQLVPRLWDVRPPRDGVSPFEAASPRRHAQHGRIEPAPQQEGLEETPARAPCALVTGRGGTSADAGCC